MSILIKVFIATPMYGGMCTSEYTVSIVNLITALKNENIAWGYSYIYNDALVTRARNKLVDEFLKSDSTHLLFIDSDIKFNPEDVIKMLKSNEDILCGLYPKKTINWERVGNEARQGVPHYFLPKAASELAVNLLKGNEHITLGSNDITEVLEAAPGFMLIKRKVFEELKNKVPSYKEDINSNEIKQYFNTSIDKQNKLLITEGYHFCRLWRSIGGKIKVACWVSLVHVGQFNFG